MLRSLVFELRPRVILFCVLLSALFLRLSWWQWERHVDKKSLIEQLVHNIVNDPQPFGELLQSLSSTSQLVHHRAVMEGRFDFAHEMYIRNRRLNGVAGVALLTPLILKSVGENQPNVVLVNRGFIPLEDAHLDVRKKYQTDEIVSFIGLIKESNPHRMFAPQDPETGSDKPWVDGWLRVDIDQIQKQLPYRIAPVYVEMMDDTPVELLKEQVVHDDAERSEILSLALKRAVGVNNQEQKYPKPLYDAYVSPGRHLGYVFEWGAMALMTILGGIIAQLKRSNSLDNHCE